MKTCVLNQPRKRREEVGTDDPFDAGPLECLGEREIRERERFTDRIVAAKLVFERRGEKLEIDAGVTSTSAGMRTFSG